jgi:WD40 repeat protein
VIQGTILVTAHSDGTVALWDLDKGERVASTRRLDGSVTAVAFTGDADRVAVAGGDGKLMLLDRKSGSSTPATSGDGHREAITAMIYVGERNGLLTASSDKTIRSWNADSLSRRRTHVGHRDGVSALDVASDGRTFASGADDGQVRLWSTLSSSVRKTLRAHDAKITALAHAANGDTLASGAADGTVKLWDLKSGRELAFVPVKAGAVRALLFTSDSRRLIVASDDGTVKAWDIAGVRLSRNE